MNEEENLSIILKYRADHHDQPDQDSDSEVLKYFLSIPEFEKNLIDQYFKEFRNNHNIKQLLLNLSFNYNYNDHILSQLLLIPNDIISDKAIIIVSYQLLSYIYFNDSKKEENDFQFFIQLLINYSKTKSSLVSVVNYLFQILMNYTLKSNNLIWSKDNAAYVIMYFTANDKLPSSFYSIFVNFSKQIMKNNDNNVDFRRNIIMLIHKFLHEKREIIKDIVNKQDFSFIYEINRQMLSKFDRTAFNVIDELSFLQEPENKSNRDINSTSPFEIELKMIPPIFAARAKQFKIEVNSEPTKIHDIPSSISKYVTIKKEEQHSKELQKQQQYQFQPEINKTNVQLRISSSSFLFVDEDNFSGKLDMPPSELCVEPFLLFKNVSKELRELSFLFKDFIIHLNPRYIETILNETTRVLSLCYSSDCYSVFAAFLMTLNHIPDSTVCDNYLPVLFDFLFNSEYTVFGPYELDPTINEFRSVIIDMIFTKAPLLLHYILKYFHNQPFLFTEIIGRYYYNVPVKLLMTDKDFELISEVNDALRFLKAPSKTRSTILSFIFLYLKTPNTYIECLSSMSFIDNFFKIIFEKGLSEMFLLSVLSQSFSRLDIDYSKSSNYSNSVASNISSTKLVKYHSLIPLRDFLYKSANTYDQIDQVIFTFVAKISKLRPKCVKLFQPFLELMIDKLAVSPSENATKNSISFLTSILSLHSQDGMSFSLDYRHYKILIDNIQYITYTEILNLISSSFSVTSQSVFLIKRPLFLPFLFFKFKDDSKQTYRIIDKLLNLAEISQFNCRALHDGKVDLILLHILNHDPMVNINGYKLNLTELINDEIMNSKNTIKMIVDLVILICSSKSNGEVANYFTQILTLPNDNLRSINLTLDILISILLSLSNEPKNQYEIGNISEFCTVEGLQSNVLKNHFSFFFMLKIDQLFFKNAASGIELITFSNKADQSFSICLINGVLCAKFQRRDLQTKVVLCPRINYNHWEFYTIIFTRVKSDGANGKYEYSVNTYRNMERLHDSDFCDIVFESGPIKLKLGGYFGKNSKIHLNDKKCGSISSVRIYNRCISRDEIQDCISFSDRAPNDYFFSTLNQCNFPSKEDIKVCRSFSIVIKNPLNLYFTKDCFDCEMLDECICHFEYEFIKSLIQDFTNNQSYLSKIISLLSFVLCKSNNQHLSADFASILFNKPYTITYEMFKCVIRVVNSIENKQTKFYWLEDVVFNFALWEKSRNNNFKYILIHISNDLNQYKSFLHSKSYFSYFLIFFNKHINDSNIIDDFIEFLARLSSTHLTYNDCDLLFSYYSNSSNKITYLRLIHLMTVPLLKLKYPACNHLLSMMNDELKNDSNKDNSIQFVLYTILCLHSLYQVDFPSHVVSIMKLLSIDLDRLLIELEKFIPENPNLFSLTTAIAFTLKHEKVTAIPDSSSLLPTLLKYVSKDFKLKKLLPLNNNYQYLWFVFPLFYAMAPSTDEMTRSLIFDYIAANSVYYSIVIGVDSLMNVISLIMLISFEIENYSSSSNNFDPIRLILIKMVDKLSNVPDQLKSFNDTKVIYSLLKNSIMAIFFNLNGRKYNDEIINSKVHDVNGFNNFSKPSEKVKIDTLNSLADFFEKVKAEPFNFCYNLEIDVENNVLNEKFLLEKVLSISTVLLAVDFQMPDVPMKKNGFFSQVPEFTIHDLLKILHHFNDQKHTEIRDVNEFDRMNTIFDWFTMKITDDFTGVINVISQLVTFSFVEKELVKNDDQLMVKFEHDELNRIAELFKIMIEEKPTFSRDTTLNYLYYTHLMKRKKTSNRHVLRFSDSLSNPTVSEQIYIITLNRQISANLEIKENEILLSNFSNRPDHFKHVPFLMLKKVIYINQKTILILTKELFNKSYLIEFNRNNSNFFEALKKLQHHRKNSNNNNNNNISSAQNFTNANMSNLPLVTTSSSSINPSSAFDFQILSTKDDVINYFSSLLNSLSLWNNKKKITAFDYLNAVNLMNGRTYLSNSNEYPIFPSPEMLKGDSTISENEEYLKKALDFPKPEVYYFFDETNNNKDLMEIYENRKLLESSASLNSIHEFVKKNFPNAIKKKEINLNEDTINSHSNDFESNNLDSSRNLNATSSSEFNHTLPTFPTPQELDIKCTIGSNGNLISKQKIIFASPLKLQNKSLNAFCIVYNTGIVSFINVTFDSGGNAKCDEIGRKSKIKNSNLKSIYISDINKGVIVLDEKSLYTFTQEGSFEKANVFFEQHLFSHSLFMRTPSIVSQSLECFYDPLCIKPPLNSYYSISMKGPLLSPPKSERGYLENVRDVCFVSHKVICMAMNENLKVFALGCDDCKIRIRNLATGKKIKTVSLIDINNNDDDINIINNDDVIPRRILITNRWGFIVVNTLFRLFIFSVNGTLIQCVNDFLKIDRWFSFCSSEGFDFIGFESQEKPYCIFYFEVLKPLERKFKMIPSIQLKPKIVKVHYDSSWNSFIIISNDAKIHVLPLT